MFRATLDSNVLVSAFLKPTGPPGRALALWVGGRYGLVLSPEILDEVREVLGHERIARKYHVSHQDLIGYVRLLTERATLVLPGAGPAIGRDPSDRPILGTALAGGAAYLVTRDDDLKLDPAVTAFMSRKGVQVVSVRRFLGVFEGPLSSIPEGSGTAR